MFPAEVFEIIQFFFFVYKSFKSAVFFHITLEVGKRLMKTQFLTWRNLKVKKKGITQVDIHVQKNKVKPLISQYTQNLTQHGLRLKF